ncbi:MAG: hypothetical protein M0R46_06165 [Candidatus Muirbacterium halophilum]|nr:hypothetical protein [Candidatus Muirbacterium halophilum]MCK9475479.1 hypothetical protein [Candidatus Muirbacterium halophilum]
MKSILQKIKEEFFYEPVKYFFKKNHKKNSELIIFLHFNQCYSDFFDIAWEISYKPLLNLIDKFDNVKFILNLSGSFLKNIENNYERKKYIQKIINKSNITLSGSFTTQHISGTINSKIEENLIEDGKKNDVFWLPERSYSEELLKLIEKKGYHFVFLENFYKRFIKPIKIGNLRLFPDEIYTRYIIDGFLLSGRNSYKLKNYIKSKELTVYAEDAEVIGLWSYEKGVSPYKSIKRFKGFLEWISNSKSLKTIFPEEFQRDFEELDKNSIIKKYYAQWIEESFKGKVNQYYELGFNDFKQFLNGDKISYFRKKIENYYFRITLNEKIPEFLKNKLLEMLWINVYEFGCPGIGFEDTYLWAGILKLEKYIKVFEEGYFLEFNQGIKAIRKIRSFEIAQRIFFIDEFAQIIAFIDLKNKKFYSGEFKIYLNSIFDSEYPALFFISNTYFKFTIDIINNKVVCRNEFCEINYIFEEDNIIYKIFNKLSKTIRVNIYKNNIKEISPNSYIEGNINLRMI